VSKADANEYERLRELQHGCQRKLENLSTQRGGQFQSPQESTRDLDIECCPNVGTDPRHHNQQRERRSRHDRSGHKVRFTFRRKASRFTSSLELLLEPRTSPSESESVSSRSSTESSSIRSMTELSIRLDLYPPRDCGLETATRDCPILGEAVVKSYQTVCKAGKVVEKSKQSWEKMRARPQDGGGVKAGGSGHEANKTISWVERRHGSCVVVRGQRHVQLAE